MVINIIQGFFALLALALGIFNYYHARKQDNERNQCSYFDKKTEILRLIEECMLDPNGFIRKDTFIREIQDAKYIANAFFNNDLEKAISDKLREIEDYHAKLRKDYQTDASNLTNQLIDIHSAVFCDLKVVNSKRKPHKPFKKYTT